MTLAYIAAGSNQGDRQQSLNEARNLLNAVGFVKIKRVSPCYETEPVGGPPQENYLNEVWEVETDLPPRSLLKEMLAIETNLGRKRLEKNGPRIIDLDLLFYGQDSFDEPGLEVPHPRLHERAFVLKPMMDLVPDWIHPCLQKSIQTLFEELRNPSDVRLYENH